MKEVTVSDSGIVTQTTTRNYKPLWISYPFFAFDDRWIEIKTKQYGKLRKRDKFCYFCKTDFREHEDMGLVGLKGRTNELACHGCIRDIHNSTGLDIIKPKRK